MEGLNVYPHAAVSVNGEARLAKRKGLNVLVALAFSPDLTYVTYLYLVISS